MASRGQQDRRAGRLALSTLSLYFALMAAGLKGELQYRLNFVIWVAMGVIYQVTGFVFIWVLLARFQELAGWSLGEVAFLYGIRLLGHGLQLFAFGYVHMLEIYVREGRFDRFLVRPVPVLLHLVVSRFPVGAIGDFTSGLVLFLIANSLVEVDWSLAALVFVALAVVGAALLEAGLKLMVASLSFRFLSTRSLVFVVDDIFNNFGNYPLKIFGGVAQFVLTFGIPVAFIAYFPATVLLGRTGEIGVTPMFAYLAPVAGALVFFLAVLVWRHELPRYQSSGH